MSQGLRATQRLQGPQGFGAGGSGNAGPIRGPLSGGGVYRPNPATTIDPREAQAMTKLATPDLSGGKTIRTPMPGEPTGYAAGLMSGSSIGGAGGGGGGGMAYQNGSFYQLPAAGGSRAQAAYNASHALPSQGSIMTPGGITTWGNQNVSFSGHTAPNNFQLTRPNGQVVAGGLPRNGTGGVPGYGNGPGGVSVGGVRNGIGGGVRGVNGAGASGDIGGQLQHDLDAANARNEQRYQQELDANAAGKAERQAAMSGNYGGIYDAIAGSKAGQMDFLNANLAAQQALTGTLGATAHENESRRATQAQGAAQQSLVGRGLGNSTVVDSVKRGIDYDHAANDRAIDEANARLKIGMLGQYGQQGASILAQSGAQDVNARGQYAGAADNVIGQTTGQRIGIIDNRQDLPPDVNAYLRQLNQPGALGGSGAPGAYGPSGGGGGSSGGGGSDLLGQYLQQLLGQQGGGRGGGVGSVNDVGYGGSTTRPRPGQQQPGQGPQGWDPRQNQGTPLPTGGGDGWDETDPTYDDSNMYGDTGGRPPDSGTGYGGGDGTYGDPHFDPSSGYIYRTDPWGGWEVFDQATNQWSPA